MLIQLEQMLFEVLFLIWIAKMSLSLYKRRGLLFTTMGYLIWSISDKSWADKHLYLVKFR